MEELTKDELAELLNTLLEAERAGSRVALESAAQADDPSARSLLEAVQKDEAKWCGVLLKAIRALPAEPSRQTGAFYEKAIAIADLGERLVFLNRGQSWVARKLVEALPRIPDTTLRKNLGEMLARHEHNIRLTEDHLSG